MVSESKNLADERETLAREWATSCLSSPVELRPITGDASFRRYFRLNHRDRDLILMDAPPEREDSRPFIDICARLRQAGLHAPEIVHFDLQQGFGLLEDLGDQSYRQRIDYAGAERCFPELFDCLITLATEVDHHGLPAFDQSLLKQELNLFTEWYLGRHKGIELNPEQAAHWQSFSSALIDRAINQPQVFVHRDFHSMNLLRTPGSQVGIIDFQDAVSGPLCYDFISLLWDRYWDWPTVRLKAWQNDMRNRLSHLSDGLEWELECDWMSLQRNTKIVGIFARLHYRDQRAGYLEMIPHFYKFLLNVVQKYPEFDDWRNVLEQPACAP